MTAAIGQQMQQLYSQFGEIPGITIELHKELLAIRVQNQQADATVFLQGAQLSHYQKQAEPPIIWCSPLCDYQGGQPLRGGIPLCWPWFGNLADNPKAVQQQIEAALSTENNTANNPIAAHGFVRNRLWSLSSVENINEGHTRLTLQLSLATGEEPLWPHACDLKLTIDVSNNLTLRLQVTNNSEQSLAFSSALHSYFAIANIEQVAVNGLEELPYIDALENRSTKVQQGSLTFNQEVDRIYKDTKAITLTDKHWQRVITVENQGSNSTVLWNPWQDKARRLSHFADDAYKEMLCIETANADEDFVQLAAGKQHVTSVTISSRGIS